MKLTAIKKEGDSFSILPFVYNLPHMRTVITETETILMYFHNATLERYIKKA